MAVRVLIADDHVALRRSLIRALQTETGMEVVGEAGDGGMAVELAKTLNPDIVIMDIVMPLVNGIDATRQIVHDCPHTLVIGLSVHTSRAYATRMFKAGASAYVLKNGDLDELVHAVDAVSHGETYLSPEVPGADSHHTPATG
jgi:DNA-binding NarL/FixJ family response regulator